MFTPAYAAAVRAQFEEAYARMCAHSGEHARRPTAGATAATLLHTPVESPSLRLLPLKRAVAGTGADSTAAAALVQHSMNTPPSGSELSHDDGLAHGHQVPVGAALPILLAFAPTTGRKAAPRSGAGAGREESGDSSGDMEAALQPPPVSPPQRRVRAHGSSSLAAAEPDAKAARLKSADAVPAAHLGAVSALAPPPLLGSCSICWEGISAATAPDVGLALAELRPCEHVYHAHCITPWLAVQNTCPQCRMRVSALWGRGRGLVLVPPADALREHLYGVAPGRMPYDDTVCQARMASMMCNARLLD